MNYEFDFDNKIIKLKGRGNLKKIVHTLCEKVENPYQWTLIGDEKLEQPPTLTPNNNNFSCNPYPSPPQYPNHGKIYFTTSTNQK